MTARIANKLNMSKVFRRAHESAANLRKQMLYAAANPQHFIFHGKPKTYASLFATALKAEIKFAHWYREQGFAPSFSDQQLRELSTDGALA